MMEKLGEPQTHLALKEMIKTVDEDNDGQISFREVSFKVSLPIAFKIQSFDYPRFILLYCERAIITPQLLPE